MLLGDLVPELDRVGGAHEKNETAAQATVDFLLCFNVVREIEIFEWVTQPHLFGVCMCVCVCVCVCVGDGFVGVCVLVWVRGEL